MGKEKEAEPKPDLGLRIKGAAREGHKVEVTRADTVKWIFGTDDELQANAGTEQ